jgi:hypothetical protein
MAFARTVLLRSADPGRSPDGTGLDRSKQIGITYALSDATVLARHVREPARRAIGGRGVM